MQFAIPATFQLFPGALFNISSEQTYLSLPPQSL